MRWKEMEHDDSNSEFDDDSIDEHDDDDARPMVFHPGLGERNKANRPEDHGRPP